ncbi:hypothetical protein Mal64_30020 [Pseudobythopirellula maris]|uniref:GH10 domain-containing protein n=1 Tax=Pseudobythopirellula maris TaxID=2527991 RepID=A0A5C5ZM01_9BACT|nr:hypothetical protein [Pseudobythopirellula maris]TWT87463.1 hypothetical protein Mal64_30020 [Pseudobythopirellula maris]
MGQLRFVVNDPGLLDSARLARAYVAGGDEVPFHSRVFMSGDRLVAEYSEDGSGCIAIPWPIGPPTTGAAPREEWLLSSATLMAREAPYRLEVELARGEIYRLRNQLAQWEMLGLAIDDGMREAVLASTKLFARAATSENLADASRFAAEALASMAEASWRLAASYTDQAIDLRTATQPRLPTLLGVQLSGGAPKDAQREPLLEAVNLAVVDASWMRVEASEGVRDWSAVDDAASWARKNSLRVCCGPLLEFDERSVPDWAYLWEGDFDTVSSLMIEHVAAVVERFRGRVQLWNLAGRLDRPRTLSLSDDQRLQIVVGALNALKQLDPKTPVVVGFEQPWCESLRNQPTGLTALEIADSLERANLGIAGFLVELNLGSGARHTASRNPLAYSRLIDAWNVQLDLPLMLSITTPAEPHWDAERQSAWARHCLPLLIAKNSVQVATWGALDDRTEKSRDGSEATIAGLFDEQGEAKPLLAELTALRKRCLS